MQTTLTKLVAKHLQQKHLDPDDFIKVLVKCENVHIVTLAENYAARKAEGDYQKAKIILTPWKSLDEDSRHALWKKMLRGKVANAQKFFPGAKTGT